MTRTTTPGSAWKFLVGFSNSSLSDKIHISHNMEKERVIQFGEVNHDFQVKTTESGSFIDFFLNHMYIILKYTLLVEFRALTKNQCKFLLY